MRSLAAMLELHEALERAVPSGLDQPERGPLRAAELLPSHALGEALAPLQLPLYDRVMASQRAAAYTYLRAIGEGEEAEGDEAAGEEDSMVALGDWGVERTPRAAGQTVEGSVATLRASFKRLYMEILTEGAAEDLDGLRRSEALDKGSLSMLVDALEAGAETFDDESRRIAMDSYDGPSSWWERAHRTREAAAHCVESFAAEDSAVLAKAAVVEAEVRAIALGGKKAKGGAGKPARSPRGPKREVALPAQPPKPAAALVATSKRSSSSVAASPGRDGTASDSGIGSKGGRARKRKGQ